LRTTSPKDALRMGTQIGMGGSADPVRMYLKEIGRVPLLVAQEEVDLAKRIEAGTEAAERLADLNASGEIAELDPLERRRLKRTVDDGEDAKAALTQANLRLVVSIAKRYVGRGMLILDLIQGEPGAHAGGREVRLHQGLQVLHLRHVVDPPGHHPGHRRSGSDDPHPGAHGRVDQQGPSGAAPDDPGARAGPDHRGARRQGRHDPGPGARDHAHLAGPLSLDSPVGEEDDSNLADFIEDQHAEAPAEMAARKMLGDAVVEALDQLNDREKAVVRLRFGLDDGQARTLEEVGREFGVTRERIRQIESKTLAKLRHPTAARSCATTSTASDAQLSVGSPVKGPGPSVDSGDNPPKTRSSTSPRDREMPSSTRSPTRSRRSR